MTGPSGYLLLNSLTTTLPLPLLLTVYSLRVTVSTLVSTL